MTDYLPITCPDCAAAYGGLAALLADGPECAAHTKPVLNGLAEMVAFLTNEATTIEEQILTHQIALGTWAAVAEEEARRVEMASWSD